MILHTLPPRPPPSVTFTHAAFAPIFLSFLPFSDIQVSARTNQNVEAAFRTLVRAMSEQKNGYTSSQNAPGAGLGLANGGAPPRRKKRGGKCVIL